MPIKTLVTQVLRCPKVFISGSPGGFTASLTAEIFISRVYWGSVPPPSGEQARKDPRKSEWFPHMRLCDGQHRNSNSALQVGEMGGKQSFSAFADSARVRRHSSRSTSRAQPYACGHSAAPATTVASKRTNFDVDNKLFASLYHGVAFRVD